MWTHLSPSPRHSCVAPAHMKSPRTALALLLFLLLLAARLRGLARRETEVAQTAAGSYSASREPRPELGDVLAELQHRREEVGRACREHRTELGELQRVDCADCSSRYNITINISAAKA